MQALVAAGRVRFIEGVADSLLPGEGFAGLVVRSADGTLHSVPADAALAFFGLAPKLGPIAEWGLELEKKALKVDTEKFQTNVPGIFAVGDINTYPGKKKLILSGFHEAALAAFGIQAYLYPAKRQFLQYTTTSPVMHKRLGVGEEPAAT
jgi:thioredoxin reductase (NADPH)